MNTIKALLIGAGLTAFTLACVAQEDETMPEVYTYASYFYCPGGPLNRVDAMMAEGADRMDGFVADGTIQSWGWLAHHTGGQWTRVAYHQASSLDALLDASDAIQGNGGDDGDDAAQEEEEVESEVDEGPTFGEICNSHDDYIWQVENGMVGTECGAAGFSVYHICDIKREDRADEIVAEHFAPVFNQMVEDGELTSWTWQSHVVGGRFRKLQTMTAADPKALLAARNAAISAVYEAGSESESAGEEFSDICGEHVDYMWNILQETP